MTPSEATPVGSGSRVRNRSRMRASTPTTFSMRAPTPVRSSTPSRSRSSWSSRNAPTSVSIPRVRGRSMTPQRVSRENSTRKLLRKMESDVGFYNKAKRALSQKDNANQITGSCSEDERAQIPPQSPKLKSDMSNSTLTTGADSVSQQSSIDLASSRMYLVRDRSMEYGSE